MNGEQNPAGASSGAPAANAYTTLSSSRASPYPTSSMASMNAMAAPHFMPHAQSFRPSVASQVGYPLSIAPPVNSFAERDATKTMGTSYSATPPAAVIHNLPLNTSEESIRLMMVFSKDLVNVDVLPTDPSADDVGSRSALLTFKTAAGVQEAKNMLDGKSISANTAELVVEIVGSSPINNGNTGRRYPLDTNLPPGASSANSSAASSATSSRQTSRFNGAFQSLDKIAPPMNGVYSSSDLTSPEPKSHYQNIFSPQSPIGNHLAAGRNGNQVSGKSVINDAQQEDDEEFLLMDPVGYAENGALQRRQTSQQPPLSRMASLSLNTTPANGHAPIPHYGHPGMSSLGGISNTMSPTAMGNMAGPPMGYGHHQTYRQNLPPPANPADQNPPCNTLYVGNLPIDTSEEELKAMFSKQRGYKRLCFRTKQNGPMCFVEFEDVSFATKALNELYGQPLHNSIKGGIRLSFSKNPLGVRSGQTSGQNPAGALGGLNGVHPGSANGFTTANGPPPGLAAPPGLGMNRAGHSGSPSLVSGGGNNPYNSPAFANPPPNNPWGSMYNSQTSAMMGSSSNMHPHMMGR